LINLLATENISPRSFIVGFSGGVDSSSLLLSLANQKTKLNAPLTAIHFNHGLHEKAPQWQAHCEQVCEDLGMSLKTVSATVHQSAGTSIEEAARNFRYSELERLLLDDDIYLTAHQADDQAETLLLNLMRGSGIQGLAAIPEIRKLGAGWVVRPILNCQRKSLESYLEEQSMRWIEDPANADESFDRNFMRHSVIPLLERRWPLAGRNLHVSADLARSATITMSELLSAELNRLGAKSTRFPLDAVNRQLPEVRSNLLRQWLQVSTGYSVPRKQFQEFLSQLESSSAGKQPELCWQGWLAKKFRNNVWLQKSDSLKPCPKMDWNNQQSITLPEGLGKLELTGKNVSVPDDWCIRRRKNNSKMQLGMNGGRRTLKHLLQEYAIPQWMRDCLPVLHWGSEVAAVGDWLMSHRMKQWLSRHEAVYIWTPDHPVLSQLRSDCHDDAIDPPAL
jgi:tRNA(Ile)-lysidine synthase